MGDKASKTKRTKRLFKLFVTGVAVGLVIVELLSLVWGPVSRNERGFAKRMKALSAMADGSEVMLTDITPFSWEAVYSFDPYMTKAEMEKILGFQSRNLEETTSEGMVQLVFVDGQKVVCCISGYSKSLGYSVDLGQQNDGNPYRRIHAGFDRFILEKESGIPSLLFLGEEFEGAIEEVYPEGAVIKIDDGWAIRSSGDRVTIRLSEEQWKTAEIGGRVRVTYDGMVMETYPLQLGRHQVKVLLVKPGTDHNQPIEP